MERRVLPMLCWLIIVLGVALRVDHYLVDRSLWLDEAMLAVNFRDRTLLELLQPPLDYHDRLLAPPGFLAATKFVITVFGSSDWAFRLFPWLCGVASLVLFHRLAGRVVSAPAVPLALFLFAVSASLIDYSSEFKQYSSDVAVAVALLLLALRGTGQPLTGPRLLVLAAGGAIAVWFSHPAVFVLASAWAALVIRRGVHGGRAAALQLGVLGLVWVASTLAMLAVSSGNVAPSPVGEYFVRFWQRQEAFMPAPLSATTLAWPYRSLLRMLAAPGALGAPWLAAGLGLVGLVALSTRGSGIVVLLASPIMIAMVASSTRRYPFHGRLLLFLLPVVYLAVAEGIVRVRRWLPAHPVAWVVPAGLFLAVCLLKSGPLYERRAAEEIKPVLRYVEGHRRQTDIVYVYYWAEPAFRHYARAYGFDDAACRLVSPIPKNADLKEIDFFRQRRQAQPAGASETRCVLGSAENLDQARLDLEQLRGRGRVWVIFAHAKPEEARFVNHLDLGGTRLAKFSPTANSAKASVYLYAL